ncbi:hypothetical protein BCR32DRAFT_268155 [Anaeromyces robustus]|uniref:FAR-17a/AIG1-like protein n=1 Tax=Anaeromyces robustus TaxID=1754192 RepID=A0A1Y1X794_9FUNG|nr:hypothetical protein BCR32DRAFT_268155 [Anaeromyces robustus]|eukprot:ORX81641.1 hypothetical protein BCR32DRAFT_268155 [Anaeromyces robustus]
MSSFFDTDKFNLQQIITPIFGSKKNLLTFRLFAFVFLFLGLILSIYNYNFNYNEASHIRKGYFSYFTNQTYIAIILYYILCIYFHIKDNNHALPKRFKNENLNSCIHIFFNVIVPLAFLVTVIFWGLISPILDTSRYNALNYLLIVIQHSFQSIFLGLDWFLISLPTNIYHSIPMIIVGICYVIFAHIFNAMYGIWIYKFLDTSNKHWVGIYIGVFTFWILFGVCFTFVHKIKNKMFNNNNSENQKKTATNNKKTK